MSDYLIQAGETSIEATSITNGVAIHNISVDVIRMTRTTTGTGTTEVPVVLVNDMPCHIKWKSGGEKILFNKETHYLDAILRCRKPAGVTILKTDKISYLGEIYEIVDMNDFNNLGTLLVMAINKVT